MAKRDKFVEMKIKLVMKLRRMSRSAAVAEIARMDAARKGTKKVTCEEGLPDETEPSAVRATGVVSRNLTAEDFFMGE